MTTFVRERTTDSVIYTHGYLWLAGRHALQEAEKNQNGSHINMTFAFLGTHSAFEAYINFLYEIILPEDWEKEKIRRSYIETKIANVATHLGLNLDRSSCEYITFLKSKDYRNEIAHGKTHRPPTVKKIISDNEPEDPIHSFSLPWEEMLDISKLKNLRESLEQLANSIHAAAIKKHPHLHNELMESAFPGRLGSSSSVTKSIPKLS